jgi:hypothetical protein
MVHKYVLWPISPHHLRNTGVRFIQIRETAVKIFGIRKSKAQQNESESIHKQSHSKNERQEALEYKKECGRAAQATDGGRSVKKKHSRACVTFFCSIMRRHSAECQTLPGTQFHCRPYGKNVYPKRRAEVNDATCGQCQECAVSAPRPGHP